MDSKFLDAVRAAFPKGKTLTLGAPVVNGECHPEPIVAIPLAMMNRHGLIAGATGTGKTKTLQLMAEQLSTAGVPVFLADIKGDVSGIGAPGESNDRIAQRVKDTGASWNPAGFPVEFLSLTGVKGAQLRATVSSFGPLLLSKVLSLNETQASVLSLVFKFADDKQLPLLDFADLRAVLQYLTGDGAGEQQRAERRDGRAELCTARSREAQVLDRVAHRLPRVAGLASARGQAIVGLARDREPREVAFDVGEKDRHALGRELLGQHLQRAGLARAGGAGDQTVAIHHRQRHADDRLGQALAAQHRCPDRERLGSGAECRLRRLDELGIHDERSYWGWRANAKGRGPTAPADSRPCSPRILGWRFMKDTG